VKNCPIAYPKMIPNDACENCKDICQGITGCYCDDVCDVPSGKTCIHLVGDWELFTYTDCNAYMCATNAVCCPPGCEGKDMHSYYDMKCQCSAGTPCPEIEYTTEPTNSPTTKPPTTHPSITKPPTTKPPTTNPPANDDGVGGSCFSSGVTVQVLSKGSIAMKDLEVGDQVLVSGSTTAASKYEPVYAFGHLDRTKTEKFLQIYTTTGVEPLEITRRHLVFLDGHPYPIAASSLQVGDVLQGDTHVSITKIATITRRDGIYAPLTPSGTLLVNGIRVSSYVSVQQEGSGEEYVDLANEVSLPLSQHELCHAFLSPLRLICMWGVPKSRVCESYTIDGKHVWVNVGLDLAALADKQPIVVQLILVALVLLMVLTFLLIKIVLVGFIYSPFRITAVAAMVLATKFKLCILSRSQTGKQKTKTL
jgi:hypothetical protein